MVYRGVMTTTRRLINIADIPCVSKMILRPSQLGRDEEGVDGDDQQTLEQMSEPCPPKTMTASHFFMWPGHG